MNSKFFYDYLRKINLILKKKNVFKIVEQEI